MEELLSKIGQLNNSATASYGLVLERVMRTSSEMLRDRGYTVSTDCRTIGDITYKMEHNAPVLRGERAGNPSITLYFHNEERVGVKQLRQWNELHPNSDHIIVSVEGPTSFTRKEVEQVADDHTQFFMFKSLCANITRHSLVPKHERMSPAEVFDLPVAGSIPELPKLYTTDPISQYYNYKCGDLIRVTRIVGCSEPVFYYRTVCLPPAS